MIYTKEQKKKIRETVSILVKDLRELWEMYPYEEIQIYVQLYLPDYGKNWFFIMNKKDIFLKAESNGNYTHLQRKGIKNKPYSEGDYEAHRQFIAKYEYVRAEVERIQSENASRVQKSLDSMDNISSKYSSESKAERKRLEASVQIDFNSQNRHEIEITEENGQTVGTINFGKQTIKIMTEGDIILVDKRTEAPKIKQK